MIIFYFHNINKILIQIVSLLFQCFFVVWWLFPFCHEKLKNTKTH